MSIVTLKKFTQARINLAKSGSSLATAELLALKKDLAYAKDSVLLEWDYQKIHDHLLQQQQPTLLLYSRVNNRRLYLQRPDLGRLLSQESTDLLKNSAKNYDIVFIISDGLSTKAIEDNFLLLWQEVYKLVSQANFRLAPLCLVPFARVAISDAIGLELKAKLAIMIIGERPGLSSPNSLGIYLTYNPSVGTTDANRNCISNIHVPNGLSYQEAAQKLLHLITQSFTLKLSGVLLKDNSDSKKQLNS